MDDSPNKEGAFEKLLCARFGTPENFFRWYEQWFRRRARSRGVPECDWQDLAKDALKSAVDQVQRGVYRGNKEQLPAWLRAITEGVISDYWRRRKRRDERSVEVVEFTDDPQDLSDKLVLRDGLFAGPLVEHSEDFERKQLVEKTFSVFPEEEKRLLLLQIQGGFTTKDISVLLGIPENTVSGILKRAKDAFRIIFTKLSREGILLPFTSAMRQHKKEKGKEKDA